MGKLAKTISDKKYSQSIEISRSYKQFACSLVSSHKKLRILDLGCGTGVNASNLSAMGHEVVGIDVSPVAIEAYNRNGFNGLVCDVIQGTPFASNSFDLVFASDIIEHLDDPTAMLRESYRVLVRGGILMVTTINSAFWAFRLAGLLGLTVTELQHPGHLRFFSKRGLIAQVKEANFKDVSVAGRNMYLILAGNAASRSAGLLERIGFKREIRFRTQKPFWHLSKCVHRASPLWADEFILTACKL